MSLRRQALPAGRILSLALLLGLSPMLSGCLWLNTLFNGRKAWDMAERARDRRLRKDPTDTVRASGDEKTLYLRAIAKGSKVMEVWPDDSSWHPEALILIGRSQQRLGDCDRATRSFMEIADRYPEHKRAQPAIQGCVECLVELGRFAEAETWMRRLDSLKAEGGPAGVAWLRAKLYLGRLDTASARGELARLLSMKKVHPVRRAEASWLKGELEWQQKDWAAARATYTSPDMGLQARPRRYRARLRGALCLDALERTPEAIAELDALAQDATMDRDAAESWTELGRIQLRRGFWNDALASLAHLESLREPPGIVAEGLVLGGEDARLRRIDYREALRLYEMAARVGGETFWGKRAQELALALGDLAKLRQEKVADSARAKWNFDLAEIFLLRLNNLDSAAAAYGRVSADTSAPVAQRARATYALAWIGQARRPEGAGEDPKLWLEVAGRWPGTVFARKAQELAGVPVTTVTREDSAEAAFRAAEKVWLSGDPVTAISLHEAIRPAFPGTIAGDRSWFAIAWLHDNERADSATAAMAYKRVVDSLPNTPWATWAQGVLKGEARDFGTSGPGFRHNGEEDFDEGIERIDPRLGPKTPRGPKGPALESPDEPEAIPPSQDDQFLDPDSFQ